MPQLATAFLPLPSAPELSSAPDLPAALEATKVAETLATIVQAGRTITDLRARLADAERTVATLTAEKRALKVELRAFRPGAPAPSAPAPQRNHRDEAIAALVEGLGPDMVRLAPQA